MNTRDGAKGAGTGIAEARRAVLAACLVMLLMASASPAATRTWTAAAGTNDWFVASNWSDSTLPSAGDDVVITTAGAGVLLTNASTAGWLASFTIGNGATLVFSNWDTTLSATSVLVQAQGQLTHVVCNTNTVLENTNRLVVLCSNLTIDVGGAIDTDGRGYVGGINTNGQGPGGGKRGGSYGSGAGHGGKGGSTPWDAGGVAAGVTNDLDSAPALPGSGGGGSANVTRVGGTGGGCIVIQAAGDVTVNGVISACGLPAGNILEGSGSGGAIHIVCRTLQGESGTIRADGGKNLTLGNGGGGRVAVIYNETAQAAIAKPRVILSAKAGESSYDVYYPSRLQKSPGDLGTVYLSSSALLDPEWVPHSGVITIPGFNSWTAASLCFTNGWFKPALSNFALTASQDIRILGPTGKLELSKGSLVSCGRDLILTNGGVLILRSGPTNVSNPDYGLLVSVTGRVSVGAGCQIQPIADGVNGGSPFIRAGSIVVEAQGGVIADGRGFSGATPYYGPGKGKNGTLNRNASGGGHGGKGGDSPTSVGGITYGNELAPQWPGSSGASTDGGRGAGNGGGLIRMESLGNMTINGIVSANGQSGYAYAGGAGGGIWLNCRDTFWGGTAAVLRANGAGLSGTNWDNGGGGGGRIAVWVRIPAERDTAVKAGQGSGIQFDSAYSRFSGQVSTDPGLTNSWAPPGTGTVQFVVFTAKGTMIMLL